MLNPEMESVKFSKSGIEKTTEPLILTALRELLEN
jgi:hypothetical protein